MATTVQSPLVYCSHAGIRRRILYRVNKTCSRTLATTSAYVVQCILPHTFKFQATGTYRGPSGQPLSAAQLHSCTAHAAKLANPVIWTRLVQIRGSFCLLDKHVDMVVHYYNKTKAVGAPRDAWMLEGAADCDMECNLESGLPLAWCWRDVGGVRQI